MTTSLNETPRSNRLHIGFFGKRNSGKSSVINAFAGHEVSIVSDVAGTTTDPVYKSMEIHDIGACVLVDTAGFDDIGELGKIRVEKTRLAAEKTDIAVILFTGEKSGQEIQWFNYFKQKKTPVIAVINKSDAIEDIDILKKTVEDGIHETPILISSKTKCGFDELKERLIRIVPEDFGMQGVLGSLVADGDTVMLVMPQDIQAPKGRIILPQVQIIRELLDKKCVVVSITTDKLDEALSMLKNPPELIITDSQVFKKVYDKKPEQSRLTSFSTLFAASKGDIDYYIKGAKHIEKLTGNSKVLIAECCTHAPLTEDIGREKLPRLLRERIGKGLVVDVVSGVDFPSDLTKYDLVIQCGACMFNKKYVISRVARAKEQNVPMTNYGVAIAYMSGILDFIAY
ncbi:MAG: [FeFe] hydrogenase H-cluster maturation GTPase HydF [Saccharofermentanales bacterium]